MNKALTLRLPADLLSKAETRATGLGLKRTRYVQQLIEQDVNNSAPPATQKHVFASEDLMGMYEGEPGPATNARVREKLRDKASRSWSKSPTQD